MDIDPQSKEMNQPQLWKDTGAVSLSFDDGSASQLEIAVPTLNQYALHATFYINPRTETDLAPWRKVGLSGHEIGNHTVSHICSRNFGWSNRKSLETTSLAEIEDDILLAEQHLRNLLPEQIERTFCYPCYQNHVGEGLHRQSYVPIVAKHFPAARGTGEATNHPDLTDLHYLTSWIVSGWMSGNDLIQAAKAAMARKRWIIFVFHGMSQEEPSTWDPASYYHGGGFSGEEFEVLCQFLSDHKEEVQTGTVLNVAQQVQQWRATK